MKKPGASQVLLLIAAFLAPLIGGQINTETATLEPGLGALIRNLLSDADRLLSYRFPGYQPASALSTPTLCHALIGLLTVGSLVVLVAKRRVFQVPVVRIGGPLLAFLGWLVVTLAFSRFQSISIVELSEWLVYGAGFFAVVACIGRRQGPVALFSAIVVACSLLGLMGLGEYRTQGTIDPTWRIFATWTPNSLAGILAIGFVLAMGLCIQVRGALSALPWCGGICIFSALLLTGSRGGLLACSVGLVILAALSTFWNSDAASKVGGVVKIVSCAGLASLLVLLLVSRVTKNPQVASNPSPFRLVQDTTPPAAASPFARMKTETGEQSGEFRLNLWRGAVKLIASNPVGTGVGTYRFSSAKSGLTTQTHLAHESYLQLGVEAGWLGLLFLPVFIVLWLLEMVRGSFKAPDGWSVLRTAVFELALVGLLARAHLLENRALAAAALVGGFLLWGFIELSRGRAKVSNDQNLLRAAVIAAVGAVAVDNLFESGLYSFGIGWCFFALLGVGMLLAVDGVAPELVPRAPKLCAVGGAILVALILLHGGIVEAVRARTRYERSEALKFPPSEAPVAYARAADLAKLAVSLNRGDGESWRLVASVTPAKYERGEALQKAADLHPNARNLRAYADYLTDEGDNPGAIRYLQRALQDDPNNLLTLSRLVEAYVANRDEESARVTAERIVAIEQTPYFTVRSLPDIVPIETYAARAFLAVNNPDPSFKIEQLEKAVAGYQLYLGRTVPMLRAMSGGDPGLQFGGENFNAARSKMGEAAKTAELLVTTYRQLKRPKDAARVAAIERQFAQVATEDRLG